MCVFMCAMCDVSLLEKLKKKIKDEQKSYIILAFHYCCSFVPAIPSNIAILMTKLFINVVENVILIGVVIFFFFFFFWRGFSNSKCSENIISYEWKFEMKK